MTDSVPLVYNGTDFSFYYPSDWVVTEAEVARAGRIETTIAPPGRSGSLVRIAERRVAGGTPPEVLAAPAVAGLRRDPRYDEIAVTRTSFDGFDAIRWEFEVTERGIRLHKVDVVFVDPYARRAWSILTQAPAREWARAAAGFDDYRGSFQLT